MIFFHKKDKDTVISEHKFDITVGPSDTLKIEDKDGNVTFHIKHPKDGMIISQEMVFESYVYSDETGEILCCSKVTDGISCESCEMCVVRFRCWTSSWRYDHGR